MTSTPSDFEMSSLRMIPGPEDTVTAFASKFGGCPLVPPDFQWPQSGKGNPLSFICQIALPEIAEHAQWTQLPEQGMLSFFYDNVEQPWGFDPKDVAGFRVYFFEDANKLKPHPLPQSLNAQHEPRERRITWRLEQTYPAESSYDYEQIDDAPYDYDAFLESAYGKEPYHRLGGHAQLIQADFRRECQMASNGIYMGDGHTADPLAAALIPGIYNWRMLLQIDSEQDSGLEFGDWGKLYYCITRQNLAARAFDKAWLILQCY